MSYFLNFSCKVVWFLQTQFLIVTYYVSIMDLLTIKNESQSRGLMIFKTKLKINFTINVSILPKFEVL
jgi:hypothetical protein